MKKKILTGTLALAALFAIGANTAQADQGDGLRQMRRNGDSSEMRQRFQNRPELTDEQREELAELREDGDREAMREKMEEFGITPKGPAFMSDLTDDQREELVELHEDGDREAIQEQLEEWGIETPQAERMEALEDILSDSELEAIQEAQETIQDIIDDNKDELEDAGIKGFFGRIGGFFKGLFK